MHNIRNATAAVAVSLSVGISEKIIKKALYEFEGVQRRFTKIFTYNNVNFYDDYAHHPTEIKAVINGARQVYGKRKIISVFQPHRYSRVRLLKREFATSFKDCDAVILCPIYSAGEKVDKYFDQVQFSSLIAKKSKTQVINIENKKELKIFFKKNLFNDELVICMGAGSISNWIREIGQEI